MPLMLKEHEIQRLLRAFHADKTLSAVQEGKKPEGFGFSVNSTPLGGVRVEFRTTDGFHRLEVHDTNIVHTMRYGAEEVIDRLDSDADTGTVKVTRHIRSFDFKVTNEMGEPLEQKIENPLLAVHDILHMAHVASRITESVQSQAQVTR